MKYFPLFFFCLLLLFTSLNSKELFHLLEEFENEGCFLSLIENSTSDRFIVKQIKDEDPSEQFLLIVDVCASHLGVEWGIPLNRVSLIPAGQEFPGKRKQHLPATMHKLVPGASTEDFLPWENFSIHQRYHRPLSCEKLWGKLPEERKGMTTEVMKTMICHVDLLKICAFDTFIGNGDRSNPNVFYDQIENRFWGIDMAASLNALLAKIAYQKFKTIPFDPLLELYFSTLKKLHVNISPRAVEELLKSYMSISQYFKKGDEIAMERLRHHLKIFEENYSFVSLIVL
jgi:hypothetical protein